MEIEIKDRKLSSVSINSIDTDFQPDGQQLIGTMCHVSLTDHSGKEQGPGANIFFAVPIDHALPLRDVAHVVLERAHAIVQRMASFSLQEFESCFLEMKAKDVEAAKEAVAAGYPKTDRG